MARIRKKHSPAFKAQVALAAHKRPGRSTNWPGNSRSTRRSSRWKKQLLDGVEGLFEAGSPTRRPDPETLQAELYEQIGRLKMELEWVKKNCPVRLRPSGPWSRAMTRS